MTVGLNLTMQYVILVLFDLMCLVISPKRFSTWCCVKSSADVKHVDNDIPVSDSKFIARLPGGSSTMNDSRDAVSGVSLRKAPKVETNQIQLMGYSQCNQGP